MPVFEYKAYTDRGRTKTGIVTAESLTAARQKLKAEALFPVSIAELDSELSNTGGKFNRFFPGFLVFSRVSASEVSMVTRQMSTLLSAGFPLVAAVGSMAEQTRSTAFKKILSKIKGSIEEGNSFAEALSLFPSAFSPVYINMIKAGESSGTLEIVMERLADFTEKKEASKAKIQSALAYPILMAIIGFFVLLFLMTYIVPGIITIFSDMNQTLPTPTRLLIAISSICRAYWWLFMLVPLSVGILVYLVGKTTGGSLFLDGCYLRLPKIGGLIRRLSVARFSRVLGSLLENGIPMLTALGIAKATAGNSRIAQAITLSATAVEQGGEIGKSLEASGVFPSLAIQMIRVGEKSGHMEKMLEKTADLYEKEVETTVSTLTSLLEPVIILIMGGVVGFIVLSVCLPIFQINQLIK